MSVPSCVQNFPLTSFHFVDASANVVDISGAGIVAPYVKPAVLVDTAVSSGTANQVLSSGVAGGSVVWVDLPAVTTPTISEVLIAGNDALGETIVKLGSISMTNDNGATSCVLNASGDVLGISTAPDASGATREFSRKYLPVYVDTELYYLPLFATPAP